MLYESLSRLTGTLSILSGENGHKKSPVISISGNYRALSMAGVPRIELGPKRFDDIFNSSNFKESL